MGVASKKHFLNRQESPVSIQLWEERARGGLGSHGPRGAGVPCHLLGRGGQGRRGGQIAHVHQAYVY